MIFFASYNRDFSEVKGSIKLRALGSGYSVIMSIGVPIKVLHEAEGHTITCETNTGEVYRGKLIEAEDNMNCQMQNITVTYRDGQIGQLENVYIRGSKIRFLILPDMLKNAPMFKRPGGKGSGTAGRGKSAILRAQGLFIYTMILMMYNGTRIRIRNRNKYQNFGNEN